MTSTSKTLTFEASCIKSFIRQGNKFSLKSCILQILGYSTALLTSLDMLKFYFLLRLILIANYQSATEIRIAAQNSAELKLN